MVLAVIKSVLALLESHFLKVEVIAHSFIELLSGVVDAIWLCSELATVCYAPCHFTYLRLTRSHPVNWMIARDFLNVNTRLGDDGIMLKLRLL